MIKKMMRTTVAAAGFAALLLSGACAHSNAADTDNRVVEVRPDDASATGVAPGPAIADSDGNVYSSSAAPGRGNPSSVGTNTNVNHVADNTVKVTETTTQNTYVAPTTDTTTTVDTTATVDTNRDLDTARDTDTTVTTTRTETVNVPMTSSTQETTPAPTRTRLRKD